VIFAISLEFFNESTNLVKITNQTTLLLFFVRPMAESIDLPLIT